MPTMKRRWIFILMVGTLVALTTGATGLTRSLHLTGQPLPPAPPPSPMVAAPAPVPFTPPRITPRSPVVATKPRPAKARNLARAMPAEPALPPSIVLAPRRAPAPVPLPTPVARPLPLPAPASPVAIPRPEFRAPAVPIAAAAPPPTVPLPSAVAVPAPRPADSNGVWQEQPSEQEQPQINVVNDSRLSGELILTLTDAPRRWSWRRSGLVIDETIAPGEYRYEVRGPIYRMSGRPDLAGTLRCRKFKLYRIRLYERAWWEGWETMYRDFGDSR